MAADCSHGPPCRAGRPAEPRNLFRSFERIAAENSLPKIQLRHAAHCRCRPARELIVIQGHSQIAVTMEIYTPVVPEQQREAMSHMDRLLKRRRKTG